MTSIQTDIITCDTEILGGIPVFTGTRVPVKTLLDYLEAGDSLNEFIDDFPNVARHQAINFLEQASQLFFQQMSNARAF